MLLNNFDGNSLNLLKEYEKTMNPLLSLKNTMPDLTSIGIMQKEFESINR